MYKKFCIALFIAIAFICASCDSPPIGTTETQDVDEYLCFNNSVSNVIDTQFSGILPAKEILNLKSASYYYSYECATFGDPSFVVYLENVVEDSSSFTEEKQRIVNLSDYSVDMGSSCFLCSVTNPERAAQEYTDQIINDGLAISFEMAIIDEKRMSITYLVASQQDSNENQHIIMEFLKAIQGQGNGSLS